MILIYNTQTGLINSWSTNYPPAELPPLCDTLVVEGELANPASYYVSGLELVPLPEKPGPWAVWDGDEWVDPRTTADLEAELQVKRDSAGLTKSNFLLACMGTGILTPAESATAARGIVPDSFQSTVDALDPMTRDYLAVIWPAVTHIGRMDPFLLAIATIQGISDETLDALFGIIEIEP